MPMASSTASATQMERTSRGKRRIAYIDTSDDSCSPQRAQWQGLVDHLAGSRDHTACQTGAGRTVPCRVHVHVRDA